MTVMRSRILADERGNSFVEMALAAPLLATLMLGMLEVGMAYSERLQLEQAAQRTIELVMQRQVPPATVVATLTAEGALAADVPVTDVSADRWLECNGVRQTDFNTTCPGGQSFARYASVTINKTYTPVYASEYYPGADDEGNITLTGQAGIRIQ